MSLTLRRALRETRHTLWGSRAMTAALIAIVTAATLSVILTAGRSAALEQDVLASVDDAGTRFIVISSQTSEGLDPSVVARIANLHGVDWIIGLTPAQDTRNAAIPGARAVSTRTIVGQWPEAIRPSVALPPGTAPAPGTALVTETSQELAGLIDPAGTMINSANGQYISVGGRFEASPPLDHLDRAILLPDDPEHPADALSVLYLTADRAVDVPAVAESAVQLSGIENRADITVETSQTLVELQDVVSGQLSEFSRVLAAGIMAGSAVVIGLSLIMLSVSRRRDFGRRRALGATRTDLILVMAMSATIPALIGATLGVAGGLAILQISDLGQPPITFALAAIVVSVMTAALAALPAALLTAWRDPASVLRVP